MSLPRFSKHLDLRWKHDFRSCHGAASQDFSMARIMVDELGRPFWRSAVARCFPTKPKRPIVARPDSAWPATRSRYGANTPQRTLATPWRLSFIPRSH